MMRVSAAGERHRSQSVSRPEPRDWPHPPAAPTVERCYITRRSQLTRTEQVMPGDSGKRAEADPGAQPRQHHDRQSG
jgi:hypothetical protein